MTMVDWARREVEIACKNEAPDRKEGEWDYGCACYESALKAYESLMEDNHSGFSFGVTKQILIRLMEHKPLTPIEDVPDIWNLILDNQEEGYCLYQCSRMSSFFKTVWDDGKIEYDDIDRVIGINLNNPELSYYSKLVRQVVNELDPIHVPYNPSCKSYTVYTDEFLSDRKNGSFDHRALLYLITPKDTRVPLDIYYDLRHEQPIIISQEEYENRKARRVDND